MENSDQNTFASIFAETAKELEALGFIAAVKEPERLLVAGVEELSVGESFSLFFKEFSTSIDRKFSALSKPVHVVDVGLLRSAVKNRNINYLKNTGVDIVVPANYTPGIANMMMHTKGVVEGVFLISCLKTEAVRLYDWLKQIVKTGRPSTQFRWSVTNFDVAMTRGVDFIRGLPDENRRLKAPLGQVYVNFEEMFDVADSFNAMVKTLGARDAEVAAKELQNVYDMGQILIEKIKNNELTFDKAVVLDIEITVNAFVELTNVCGAMMTLLNELSAVLREQIKTVAKL